MFQTADPSTSLRRKSRPIFIPFGGQRCPSNRVPAVAADPGKAQRRGTERQCWVRFVKSNSKSNRRSFDSATLRSGKQVKLNRKSYRLSGWQFFGLGSEKE